MASLKDFNPIAPETIENPYPFYRAMREQAPVYEIPGVGFFIVSRYDDILHVLANPQIFSSHQVRGLQSKPSAEVKKIWATGWPPVDTLQTNDPPAHTRFRALVSKAFSARRVATMEPAVRTIANELLDRFIGDGRVELVSQFAIGLPLSVIADSLGVPRADMDKFKRWSDESVAPIGGRITHERQLECAQSHVEFQHYFADRLEERRIAPRDDILTDLINARLEGVDPLSVAEMLNILEQLLVAGNETTTNLIASAVMLLLQEPSRREALTADQSLIPNFVEEALRAESPVQGLFRVASADTEIGGVKIPARAQVVVMYASGNRDEAQFADAERVDISRENARMHLAFGQGVHFCIGAALARLEARVALKTILGRTRNLRFAAAGNDFTHMPSFILRGLKQLHLEFDAA